MKKATLIIIGVIYIASIVLISVFGLKSVIYEEKIPVTHIVFFSNVKFNEYH